MPVLEVPTTFRELMQDFPLYKEVLGLTDSRFRSTEFSSNQKDVLALRLYFKFIQYERGITQERIQKIIDACPIITDFWSRDRSIEFREEQPLTRLNIFDVTRQIIIDDDNENLVFRTRYVPVVNYDFALGFLGFIRTGNPPSSWNGIPRENIIDMIMNLVKIDVSSPNEHVEILTLISGSLLFSPSTISTPFRAVVQIEIEDGLIFEIDKENIWRAPSFILHRQAQILDTMKKLPTETIRLFIKNYQEASDQVDHAIREPKLTILADPFMSEEYYKHTFALHFARISISNTPSTIEQQIVRAQIETIGTIMLVDVRDEVIEPTVSKLVDFRYVFAEISRIMSQSHCVTWEEVAIKAAKYAQVYCHFLLPNVPYKFPSNAFMAAVEQTAEVLTERFVKSIPIARNRSILGHELSPYQLKQRACLFGTSVTPKQYVQDFDTTLESQNLMALKTVMHTDRFQTYISVVTQLREMAKARTRYNPMQNETDYAIHFQALCLALNHEFNRRIPLLVLHIENIFDDSVEYWVSHQVRNAIRAASMAAQHIINTFLPTPSSIFVSSQEYYALYIELHARIVDSYISIRGGENGELLRLQAQYFDQLAGDEHSEHLGVLIRNTLDAMKELGTTLIQNFRDTLAHKPHLLHMLDAFLMNITPHVQTIIQNLVQVLVNFEQYHIDFEQSEWIVYRKDYRIIVGILPENFASLVLDKPVTQLELTPIAQQKFKEGLSNPLLYARPEANHHTITNELAIAEQVLEYSAPQSTTSDESLNSEPIQQTGT